MNLPGSTKKGKMPGKVLFLARWYPNESDPMPGLFIRRHAAIAATFCDVAVLYVHLNLDQRRGFRITETIEDKVYTVRVYYDPVSPAWWLLKPVFSILKFLYSWHKGYRVINHKWGIPDLIHVNVLTRLGFIAWMKYQVKGIPYVITEHWSRYLPFTGTYKGLLRRLITRIVVHNARALSTVSQNLVQAMASHGLINRNTLILPNVVDCDRFVPTVQPQYSEIKRMVHISCFQDHSKNISGLLRVLKSLSEKRTDFECVMVGEGVDFESLKSYSDSLQLTDRFVHFTGLLEGDGLIETIRSAGFMVMFSNYENMPVVINEAFSCAIPVIATKAGGIPEYVYDWNGRLVEPGDETGLENAINYMLDHFLEFDTQKIRSFALDEFSREAVANKLKLLYHQVDL